MKEFMSSKRGQIVILIVLVVGVAGVWGAILMRGGDQATDPTVPAGVPAPASSAASPDAVATDDASGQPDVRDVPATEGEEENAEDAAEEPSDEPIFIPRNPFD